MTVRFRSTHDPTRLMWSWLAQEQDLAYRKFARFARQLTPAVGELALDRGTYLGLTELEHKMSDFPEGISLIAVLPLFFTEAFPVSKKLARKLTYCTTVGTLYALAADKLIDSQLECTPGRVFLATTLFGEFQRSLMSIFGERSRFWTYHHRYFRQYHAAELVHGLQNNCATGFSISRYRRIAIAKSAPVKISVTGLALLADRECLIKDYCASVDSFLVGLQLYDDAMDWKEDYLQNRPTPITAALASLMQTKKTDTEAGSAASSVDAIVHGSDLVERTLDESSYWFEKASRKVSGLECGKWQELLRHLIATNKRTTDELVRRKISFLLGPGICG